MICSILASTSMGGIGNRGTLPWPKHKEDLAWFKKHTTDQIVVMGRKTWDDPMMPKPLPNRVNCVFTNRSLSEHAYNARRLDGDSSEEVKLLQQNFPSKDVFVIGGKELYTATADIVERVYLTRMKGNYWTDTRIDLERYLACFRIMSVQPGENCTYEIWQKQFFFNLKLGNYQN
jgi:dihydrofolate reductase